MQSQQAYDAYVWKVMAIPRNAVKILSVGVKKALDCLRIHSVTRVHQDLYSNLAMEQKSHKFLR